MAKEDQLKEGRGKLVSLCLVQAGLKGTICFV